METALTVINKSEAVKALLDWINTVPSLVPAKIEGVDQYTGAGESCKVIKQRAKQIDELRKQFTIPLDEEKKLIMDFFRPHTEALDKAEKGIKRAMIAYNKEQERERAAQQRKLQQQAEEAARKEREALAAREMEAIMDGDTFDAELAHSLAETIETPRVVVPEVVVKVAGQSFSEKWAGRVTNIDLVPRRFLMVNDRAVQEFARLSKGTEKIPGLEFYSETIMSMRRA